MGFSRQEYCSELPFLSPGDLPNPGIKPASPTLQVDSLQSEPPEKPPWGGKNLPQWGIHRSGGKVSQAHFLSKLSVIVSPLDQKQIITAHDH